VENPAGTAKKLIFISYARANGAFALQLATDLRTAGVDIWMDQLDLHAGDTWDRAVEDALKRCTHLLVILSPTAVASRSVMDEVSYALDENKSTIPVLHQPCEIPFRLRRVQRTDFSADYSAALRQLLAGLGGEAAYDTQRGGDSGIENNPGEHEHRPAASARSERLLAALWVGAVGGAFAAIASILIFANDPRFNGTVGRPDSVLGAAATYGGVSAVLWAIAGAVAGYDKRALLAALGTALAVLAGWIAAFGTYQDVLATGVSIGAPIAGVVGAAVVRFVDKRRSRRGVTSDVTRAKA
jgi:hypothetical protein